MATLNDFKLLNLKCLSYFNLLESELNKTFNLPTEKHKERFGFYLLMIESICGIRDLSDQIEIITDQEFNQIISGKTDEDYGVDAIFIDEDNFYINFFNFKFRNEYNQDKSQGINETFLSTKLINAVISRNITALTGKTKDLCEKAIEKINSGDIWKLRLYVISNESKILDVDTMEIAQLKEMYDLETIPIGLDKITDFMSIRPTSIDATIHLNKDSLLPFTENSLSSSTSYVLRISAPELLRISCNNKESRDNYNMEDYKSIHSTKMEYNLLFDNVRGLIVNSKFNSNIFKTLKEEPSKFFMYNNGLTITATDIVSEETNANKKLKITIKDFQVVNGGQTLRTLHRFNQLDEENVSKYLSDVQILMRVFKTPSEGDLRNKIAQFTNSQNAISNVDLKSLSDIQIQIEQFLDTQNIVYARKVGDTGITQTKTYAHKISMEKFGQILFSVQGNPGKASTQKKQIFDKYYDQIFASENFQITDAGNLVKRYFEIKASYDASEYLSSDQKIFYIMYIDTQVSLEILDQISLFEGILRQYRAQENISDARKLINIRFKEILDQEIHQIIERE